MKQKFNFTLTFGRTVPCTEPTMVVEGEMGMDTGIDP